MDKEDIKEKLKSPYTALAGFATALFTDPLMLLDGVVAFVASTSGLWYPVIAGLSRLGRMVDAIPAQLIQRIVLVAVVVYVAIYAARLVSAITGNTDA